MDKETGYGFIMVGESFDDCFGRSFVVCVSKVTDYICDLRFLFNEF